MNETTAAAPPRRWRKRIAIILGLLLISVILLVGFAPSLLSTATGRGFIVSTINGSIPGEVSIDDLSLTWASGQSVQGLALKDNSGATILNIDDVQAPDLSLTSLIQGRLSLGEIAVGPSRATIVRQSDGRTNFEHALGLGAQPASSTETHLPPDLHARVTLNQVDLTYESPDLAPVAMRIHNASADMPSPQQLAIAINADAAAGPDAQTQLINATAGTNRTLEVDLTLINLADAAGKLTLDQIEIDAKATLNQLPLATVAALAAMSDNLSTILGPVANGTIRAKGKLDSLDAEINLASDHLKADIAILPAADALRVKEGSNLTLELTPVAWQQLAKDGSILLDPVTIRVNFDDFSLPRNQNTGGIDLAAAQLKANASLSQVAIDTGDERIGRLGLRDTNLTIATEQSLSRALIANLATTAYQGSDTGRLVAQAQLDQPVNAQGKPRDLASGGWSVSVDITALPVAVLDRLAPTQGMAAPALGQTLDAKLSMQTPLADPGATGAAGAAGAAGAPITGQFSARAKAPRLDLNLAGQINGDRVILNPDTADTTTNTLTNTLTWKIPVELLPILRQAVPDLPPALSDLALNQPATLTLRIGELATSYTTFDPAKTRLALTANIDQLAPRSESWPADAVLRNIQITIPPAELAATIQPKLTASFDYQNTQSPIELLVAYNAFGDKDNVGLKSLSLTAPRIPTALIDTLANQDGLINTLVGDPIQNVSITLTPTPSQANQANQANQVNQAMDFDVKLAAPRLTTALTGRFSPGTRIELAPGAQARLELTPQSFAAIQKLRATPQPQPQPQTQTPSTPQAAPQPTLTLVSPAWIEVTTTGTQLALKPTKPTTPTTPQPDNPQDQTDAGALDAIDLRQSSFQLAVKSDALTLQRPGDAQLIQLTNLRANIDGTNPAQKIEALIQADLPASANAQAPSSEQPTAPSLRISATANQPIDNQGQLQLGARKTNATAQLRQTPSILIDQLLNYDGKLTAAVGPIISLDGTYAGNNEGQLDIDLTGTNVQWTLAGLVDEDWQLTLREDSAGQFAVTREFSHEYIRPVIPIVRALSVEGARTQEPVKAVIKKQDFTASLYPFTLDKMNADIDLNLGTLILDSGSIIFQAMRIIGQLAPDFAKHATAEQAFAFSPVTVEIRQGLLSYPAMSMTRGNVVMQFGGQVNLNNQQIALTMGVPGSSINKIAHETQGYIAPDDVISIPFAGTISNPRFDDKRLVQEVAALGAKSAIRKHVPGEAGGVLGGLLDILGGKKPADPKKEDPPKEEENKDSSQESNQESNQESQSNQDPLGGLIQGIFGGKKKQDPKPDP